MTTPAAYPQFIYYSHTSFSTDFVNVSRSSDTSGNVVGRINEVTLRRARLVLGWVTVFGGQTVSVFHQAI